MNTSGYVVVRLPQLNESIPHGPVLPSIGDIRYCGVDRCEWLDVFDEAYFSGGAPPDIAPLLAALEDQHAFKVGLQLVPEQEQALRLLRYANRFEVRNEVIAVRFASESAPPCEIRQDQRIDWLVT